MSPLEVLIVAVLDVAMSPMSVVNALLGRNIWVLSKGKDMQSAPA
jgi:hypothetical protein